MLQYNYEKMTHQNLTLLTAQLSWFRIGLILIAKRESSITERLDGIIFTLCRKITETRPIWLASYLKITYQTHLCNYQSKPVQTWYYANIILLYSTYFTLRKLLTNKTMLKRLSVNLIQECKSNLGKEYCM